MTPAGSWPKPLETLAALCAEDLPVPDEAVFPVVAMQRLREAGILRAALPSSFGGMGIGSEPGKGPATLALFHRLGRLSLPLGRLIEAHVNALRIVARYGTPTQMTAVAEAVLGGDLFGLWVTDPPGEGGVAVQAEAGSLHLSGGEVFCSGAGVVRWAIATAFDPACQDQRLLLLQLDGSEQIGKLSSSLAGMKAAVTGQVDVSGRRIPQDCIIGAPGDYLREPDFSGGAWRSSAVALGGLYRLVELMREQLIARRREGDVHQRSRFGQLVTAHETGRLWLSRAGAMAEDLRSTRHGDRRHRRSCAPRG